MSRSFAVLGLCSLLCALAGCAVPERGVPDDGQPHTYSFLVSEIRVPEPVRGTYLRGFDLDGTESSAEGTTCASMAIDYEWEGQGGIDGTLNEVAPAYAHVSESSRSAGTELNRAIEEQRLLLAVEVRGVTHSGDGPVEVALLAARAPEGSIVRDAHGRPAAGATVRVTELAVATGAIEGALVHARFDSLSIPVEGGGVPLLPLDDLGATGIAFEMVPGMDGPELANGVLGTALSVDAMVADFGARVGDSAMEASMREVLETLADIEPSEGDAMTCTRLSLQLEIDAVPVVIEGR